jgi:hypothetical protein
MMAATTSPSDQIDSTNAGSRLTRTPARAKAASRASDPNASATIAMAIAAPQSDSA